LHEAVLIQIKLMKHTH